MEGKRKGKKNMKKKGMVIVMKKILGLALACIMIVSLTACNPSGNNSSTAKPTVAEPSVIAPPTNVSKDGEPITAEEREYYLAKIKSNLTLERTGRELLSNSLDSFSEFAKNDDGKPFYMINLVRENETPQYPESWKGERAKTVLDAKILYSKACAPIMGKAGSYSMTGVTYAGPEVVNSGVDVEDWDQFYLISYPNRKAFMELLASDAYADALVHKYAGDKDTLLIPVTAGKMTVKEAFPESKPLTAEELKNIWQRSKQI